MTERRQDKFYAGGDKKGLSGYIMREKEEP
jgi:hypothetical protein